MRYTVGCGDVSYNVEIEDGGGRVSVDGQSLSADLVQVNPPSLFSLLVDGRSHEVYLEEGGKGEYCVVIGGELYMVNAVTEREARLAHAALSRERPAGEVVVKAPMPGVVRTVEVTVGDVVRAGQGLIVLEAMKMENELKAAHEGTIRSINVMKGQQVEQGQTLLVIGG